MNISAQEEGAAFSCCTSFGRSWPVNWPVWTGHFYLDFSLYIRTIYTYLSKTMWRAVRNTWACQMRPNDKERRLPQTWNKFPLKYSCDPWVVFLWGSSHCLKSNKTKRCVIWYYCREELHGSSNPVLWKTCIQPKAQLIDVPALHLVSWTASNFR